MVMIVKNARKQFHFIVMNISGQSQVLVLTYCGDDWRLWVVIWTNTDTSWTVLLQKQRSELSNKIQNVSFEEMHVNLAAKLQ